MTFEPLRPCTNKQVTEPSARFDVTTQPSLVTDFPFKAALLARSRGNLMLNNWASEHPECITHIAGSNPGLEKECGAYGLSRTDLEKQLEHHNPVSRLASLAKSNVPIFHIRCDVG